MIFETCMSEWICARTFAILKSSYAITTNWVAGLSAVVDCSGDAHSRFGHYKWKRESLGRPAIGIASRAFGCPNV